MPIFSPRFKFRETELCSRDRKWPDAYRSQHKPATSVIWSRVLGVQEGWCCGPIEFDCYTAVYLPMHLCSILSHQHPRHTNEGQKQEPDYPAQSLAEIMFLQLRKFTLIQTRQVMETRLSRAPSPLVLSVWQLLSCFYPSCFLTASTAPRRCLVSASCVLAPQPPHSSNGTSLDQVYPSISQVSAYSLWSETERWTFGQTCSYFVCCCHWAPEVSLTEDGMQMCEDILAWHVKQV